MRRLPTECGCGKKFSIDDAMSCIKDGYIHRRHDELRDFIAILLNEVSSDVSIELQFVPLSGEIFDNAANIADEAPLDIAA